MATLFWFSDEQWSRIEHKMLVVNPFDEHFVLQLGLEIHGHFRPLNDNRIAP